MNEPVKEIVASITPALFWLVRRLLPVVSGWLLTLGIDKEQFVTAAAGVLAFLIGCVLMWIHNQRAAVKTAFDATHYDRKPL
jgi:hypothetical protein